PRVARVLLEEGLEDEEGLVEGRDGGFRPAAFGPAGAGGEVGVAQAQRVLPGARVALGKGLVDFPRRVQLALGRRGLPGPGVKARETAVQPREVLAVAVRLRV